jgi:hypothetical protein
MSKLGDLIKKGLGAFTGGDLASNLAANYLTSKVLGGDTKDALMLTAFQQGLGPDGFNLGNLFGGGYEQATSEMGPGQIARAATPLVSAGVDSGLAEAVTRKALGQDAAPAISKIAPVFKQDPKTLGYAKFLVDAGMLDPNSKMASLLNSRVGEAIATSLVSGLGSKLFDEEERLGTGKATRPFGGEGSVKLNIPNKYAAGGYIDGQYFPRRNGGIMPSEGSGQKDDVPAMLMAGEFVLTKDAVKGLGNGDSNRGIQKAYAMMNKLENKANNYV